MSDHLSLQELKQHRDQRLSPQELIAVDDHLVSCDACYERFKEMCRLPVKSAPLDISLSPETDEGPYHLLYDEQIVAYVDDKLDYIDREVVEGHMEICQLCADEVHDLQQFKAVIGDSAQHKRAHPALLNFTERLFNAVRPPSPRWNLSQLVVMATVIVFILLAGIFLLRYEFYDRQSPLVQQGTPNDKPIEPTPQANNTFNSQSNKRAVDLSSKNDDRNTETNSQINENQQRITSNSNRNGSMESTELLILRDGNRQISLDKQGNLVGLETLSQTIKQSVKAVLETQRVTKPAVLTGLSGASITLRGEPVSGVPFALISPVGIVVQSDRPILRWSPLGGATSYIVTVFNTKSNRVVKSEPLSTTEWTIPHRLQRGTTYSWQVTALKDGERIISPTLPAPEVQFKIIEQERESELARLKTATPNSHLVLGVVYAQEGLVDEAEQEFQALVNANPTSRVARKLLQSVQSWRKR